MNFFRNKSKRKSDTDCDHPTDDEFTKIDSFTFLEPFLLDDDVLLNGYEFNECIIPREILLIIISYLNPKEILVCSLVCKNWFNIVRSTYLWKIIYNRKEYPKKAKNLPWYIYYCYFATDNFTNLLKNGNGENQFNHWRIVSNGADHFRIENTPQGSDPLPLNIPEFHEHQSCFVTSHGKCSKYQSIELESKNLLQYIIRKFHPTIYASEWYSGRFDCACYYKLAIITSSETLGKFIKINLYYNNDSLSKMGNIKFEDRRVEQWEGKEWQKVEINYTEYASDLKKIYFYHEGKDLQFWAGHYGSKMAGGVLKFLFDSIKSMDENETDNVLD